MTFVPLYLLGLNIRKEEKASKSKTSAEKVEVHCLSRTKVMYMMTKEPKGAKRNISSRSLCDHSDYSMYTVFCVL